MTNVAARRGSGESLDHLTRVGNHNSAASNAVKLPILSTHSPRSITDQRPLARSVNQGQHPHGFAADFVHQAIAFMRHQLAGSLNLSRPPQLRVIRQPGGRITEKLIHTGGRSRVVGRNVVPNVSTILQRFRRPNDPHAWLVTTARRAANVASTSSLE